MKFVFNYQSPDGVDGHVPPNNRGVNFYPSILETDNGYRYVFRSRVKLISNVSSALGDFALCQILDTLPPPHFNVYFAGWYPGILGNLTNSPFITIHHPMRDIKKINKAPTILNLNPPGVTACRSITKTIDLIFGWIWKRKTVIEQVCNYLLTDPFFHPSWYDIGLTELNSSGAPLFETNGRFIGSLYSGLLLGCDIRTGDSYGRLQCNYIRDKTRECLNPTYDWWIDQFGIAGRQIECYDNLTLSGYYFPAKEYQAENLITLKAVNDITTTDKLRIYEGAEFVFDAGISIHLGPGFKVEKGAEFTARISNSCSNSGLSIGKDNRLSKMLKEIKLPKHKEFDLNQYVKNKTGLNSDIINKSNTIAFNVVPNPTSEIITISFNLVNSENISILLNDFSGKTIKVLLVQKCGKGKNSQSFDLSDLSSGIYYCIFRTDKELYTEKVILIK